MTCPVCEHAEHHAGECKRCNCGESEICHPSGTAVHVLEDVSDYLTRIYLTPTVVIGERHYRCQ